MKASPGTLTKVRLLVSVETTEAIIAHHGTRLPATKYSFIPAAGGVKTRAKNRADEVG